MITRERVKDLQAGDVVEMQGPGGLSVRGRLATYGEASLVFGPNVNTGAWTVRTRLGDPGGLFADWDITNVVPGPRPLYANHPRTRPMPGDVVSRGDHDNATWSFAPLVSTGANRWRNTANQEWFDRDDFERIPVFLLVDGETGQVVQ